MQKAQLASIIIALSLSVGCSSSSGSGGAGSPDDAGYGEGNIPVASAGTADLADVNFEFDSSSLSQQAKATLQENARYLVSDGGKIIIEGHCDERGTQEYNLALGERRARSVFDYLRSLGVAGTQMETVSFGEDLPLDPSSGEAAWAKNRRAHFATQ